MRTLVTDDPEVAASVIRVGGLVAFPTETVYGLGGDATSAAAIDRIFTAKGRPADNPLIVHVADADQLDVVAAEVTPLAEALIRTFAPGPITVIVRRHESLAAEVSAGLDSVGVRIPDLPLTQAFLRAAGRPIAAPSANRSGAPSPTRAAHVLAELDGMIDAVLLGPDCRIGLESTVVDARGTVPVVLREGGVSLERLRDAFPDARLAGAEDPTHHSPGTRHRHYAPNARVLLVEKASPISEPNSTKRAWIGLHAPMNAGFELVHVASDVDAYARALFDFLRRCDAAGVDTISCEWPPGEGLGGALRDRLLRASRG